MVQGQIAMHCLLYFEYEAVTHKRDCFEMPAVSHDDFEVYRYEIDLLN